MGMTIRFTHDLVSKTLYALLYDPNGNVYDTASETFMTDSGSLADYVIPLTEGNLMVYSASLTRNFETDLYTIKVYEQVGGSPAIPGDECLCVDSFDYSFDLQRELSLKDVNGTTTTTTTTGETEEGSLEEIKELVQRIFNNTRVRTR